VVKARILVIDDNAAVNDILVTCLGEEGYEVSGSLTGDEGLELFASACPDLVLLDITLSGDMNGVEVLKRIRSIDPAAKVVMVTGNPNSPLAREALELGALARVDKPFNLAHLKRVVAVALQHPSSGR
jgi:DNA-binding NtrC family response regulator